MYYALLLILHHFYCEESTSSKPHPAARSTQVERARAHTSAAYRTSNELSDSVNFFAIT